MGGCRAALKMLVLVASVLVRYDTMEILVFVAPGGEPVTTATAVEQACDVVHSLDLALPTPYKIQWGKQLPNGAVLPDESKTSTGMLTSASCHRT